MDRRNKQRIDLQLLCHLGAGAVSSAPLEGVTENISRDGILMRWLDAVPLPAVGSGLTVEFTLPESEGFGRRVMRCRTTVVRITPGTEGRSSVGLRIRGINFIPVSVAAMERPEGLALHQPDPDSLDLNAMPSATERVN